MVPHYYGLTDHAVRRSDSKLIEQFRHFTGKVSPGFLKSPAKPVKGLFKEKFVLSDMRKIANISLSFWLPLWCAALIFANFSSALPGSSPVFLFTASDYHSDSESPDSVLSAGYSKMAYLSKIVPETTAKAQTEKKAAYFLFQKDGNPTPQNGTYLAISKSITPGLTIQKLLYPFHYFL